MALEPSRVSRRARAPLRPIPARVVRARPEPHPASLLTRILKRAFDIVVCALASIVLLPVFLMIAVVIKVDSRGPVLFRQVRIGLKGKPFVILKFRTMRPGSDRNAANISPTSDPRVTRFGHFLRSSYLDELPQLINVIAGTMSIVGPRPETPEFVALYTPEERRVLDVRPGLLGPSTLASMDESELLEKAADPFTYYVDVLMRERVRLDLAYLDRISLRSDIRMIVRQAARIFGAR
jgi:lipopolysaccharide/colanic/teichoic acid biosynthesis glycosyltransferase